MRNTGLTVVIISVQTWIFISNFCGVCKANPVKFSPKDNKCIFNNNTYLAGEKFRPEPCMFCKCPRHGGRVQCGIQDCQYTANCVSYQKSEGECCGRCIQQGCKHSDGQIYHPGALISSSHCERCYCPDEGGRIQCRTVPCPDISCVNPVHDDGHCCPRCPNGSNCYFGDKILNAGEIVLESECKLCHCYDGPLPDWLPSTGKPRAVCYMLSNEEKEGCEDESMLGDQPTQKTGLDDRIVPYLLINDNEKRKILYRQYIRRHLRKNSGKYYRH